MKDAIYQDLNVGDLVVILNYHNNIGAIITGTTPSGKIKYVYPTIEYEWNEDDVNDDDEYLECIQCGGYCNGHFKGFIIQKTNCYNDRIIKITEEQLNQVTIHEESEENLEDRLQINRKLIEMYNEQTVK